MKRLGGGFGNLVRADVAGSSHGVEHRNLSVVRGLRIGARVVHPRCLRQTGEHCGLGQVELGCGDAEVPLRRRLHPDRPVAEGDVVHVVLEDLGVRHLLHQVVGVGDFPELVAQAAVVAQIEELGQLHGDGARPLGAAPGAQVAPGGLRQSQRIDSPLVPEVAVLDRHDRLTEIRRHLGEGDRQPVDTGLVDVGDEIAGAVGDQGVGGQGAWLRRRARERLQCGQPAGDERHAECRRDDHSGRGGQGRAAAGPPDPEAAQVRSTLHPREPAAQRGQPASPAIARRREGGSFMRRNSHRQAALPVRRLMWPGSPSRPAPPDVMAILSRSPPAAEPEGLSPRFRSPRNTRSCARAGGWAQDEGRPAWGLCYHSRMEDLGTRGGGRGWRDGV